MAVCETGKFGIDPALAAILAKYPFEISFDRGVEAARNQLRAMQASGKAAPPMRIEDRRIAGQIRIRIYWPVGDGTSSLPIVVFYHGGGWSIGDLDTHDGIARMHAASAAAIVVSVEYRLAPEHPFPAGIEDSWTALAWVADHAAELGGDPNRIAVAGDSAGGNIAAVMAQRARDNGGPRLVFQLLWYPSTTCDVTAPSVLSNADAPILDREVMKVFLNWYVPPELELGAPETLPADLAPANNKDLSRIAPAFISTAGHDPLRDDGLRYARLLTAAGVPVEHSDEPSLVHGYLGFALTVPKAGEAAKRGLSALSSALRSD